MGGTNTLSIAEGVKREPFFKGYFLEVTEVAFRYLILARISPTPQNASREAENIVFISGVHVWVHVWEVGVEDKHLRKCDKIQEESCPVLSASYQGGQMSAQYTWVPGHVLSPASLWPVRFLVS